MTRAAIRAAPAKATQAAMPAISPTVAQAKLVSSRPRSVSPRNRESRWAVSSLAVAWSSAISVSLAPASRASVTAWAAPRSSISE
jgi:hypothetical protein